MSKKKPEVEVSETILQLAENIQENIDLIFKTVGSRVDVNDFYSFLAAYSGLLTCAYYYECALSKDNAELALLETVKRNAEQYALDLYTLDTGTGLQKKGDA